MQLTLTDIKKTFAGRKPAAIGTHRYFSVLVPFVEKDGQLYILYEVRAKNMASQPGEEKIQRTVRCGKPLRKSVFPRTRSRLLDRETYFMVMPTTRCILI